MKKTLLSSAAVFGALMTVFVYAAPELDVAKCDEGKCGSKGEAVAATFASASAEECDKGKCGSKGEAVATFASASAEECDKGKCGGQASLSFVA